ncbi:hypothetical protein ACIQM4_25175 [Streptomyces sp. NPDC091272]|uniref:hypothetical protein n=1 Tax=Streptomyces sp. NPDC091272 TaxID=3365981 RepID=UPI003825CCBE
MGNDLHNLNAVLDALAPAVIGLPPGGTAWQDTKFTAGAPVVEIVGDRASGKTALIDALYAGYHAAVPTARVDLAKAPYSATDPVDQDWLDVVNASPVTHLLFTLSYELHKTHGGRVIEFPRLAPALLVLTAWRPDAPAEAEPGEDESTGGAPTRARPGVPPSGLEVWPARLTAAEGALRRLLGTGTPPPEPQQGGPLDVWLGALPGIVAGFVPGVPGLENILQAGITTLRERRPAAAEWEWWRERLAKVNGDGVQRLFSLVRDFRAGGALRTAVEAHLVAALLADIDGAYGFWARRNRHPPLLLLDNVDEVLRARFLDPLVREYGALRTVAHGRRRRGGVMLPAVFVTSLGDGRFSHGKRLLPASDSEPWTKPELCPPTTWLLRLGVPRVTRPEIQRMLSGGGGPAGLSQVVERLSGGRTGCALLIARAAAEWHSRVHQPERAGPGGLLDLPAPDAGELPLGARLLEMLLPDPRVRAELISLGPVLDEEAAARLVLPSAPGAIGALRVRELRDNTLALAHWDHRPWPPGMQGTVGPTPLVSDRALRALLLAALRTRPKEDARDTSYPWDRVHSRLAHHYDAADLQAEDSVRHVPRHLHHALARGQLDTLVVRAMHHRYRRFPAAEWLRDLNLVAAAPQAREDQHAAPAGPPPVCPDCQGDSAGLAVARAVHTAIRELLRTVWRLSDPLAQPPTGYKHPDADAVGRALTTLCTYYEIHHVRPVATSLPNAFVDALARDGWQHALITGVQAPDLPVAGR